MIDFDLIKDNNLTLIAQKVLEDEPVSREDGRNMLLTYDINALGMIANHIREKYHGDITYYGVNINLNYTNICELRCPLCAFSCDRDDEKAYMYTIDDIEKIVREANEEDIDEVHIVGGLNSDLKLDYFVKMLRRIKEINNDIFIVAFTAVEYDYFARLNGLSLEEVFAILKDAGLGAIPGGGAEIFADDKRGIISPKKISGKRWLEVMEIAHQCGIKSNATMLYNHIETIDDIINHMFEIRQLQEKTGGFKTFVPLKFHDENTEIKSKVQSTGFRDIRIYSTARIFLHNVPHIKALWMYVGEKMASALQDFGVDDIGGTYIKEKVVHSAGAKTSDYGSIDFLENLIKSAGKTPARSTADYRRVSKV
ncbi:MAG TPA: CofH family radical SAM protein [Spirochaetota bacterium]|nr:CofH family radical SAM protein [Spirochaetota bacterium]